MFQGDIAQFAPADLLLFLCHMNKEGMLTVRQEDASLNLSFKGNLLVDTDCEAADALVLKMMAESGAAPPETIERLRTGREETGLPLTRILDDVPWLAPEKAKKALAAGLRETVFRLLLWEKGAFQFTEMVVDDNPHLAPMDGQAIVMDLTREVDEYRELLRGLGSLERPVRSKSQSEQATAEEQYVLVHAGAAASVETLLATAPYPRLSAAWAVSSAVEKGWLEFVPGAETGAGADDQTEAGGHFPAYRLALRRLLQAEGDVERFSQLLGFAQSHCTQSILFGVSGDVLKRATVYHRDENGRLAASDHRDPDIDLASDLVFHQALVAGRPFVGAAFPSAVIEALGAAVPAADCALLPLGRLGDLDLLLHAVTAEPSGLTGPLACLELLSWQVKAPRLDRSVPAAAGGEPATGRKAGRLDGNDNAAAELVASIKDLPPMPHVVARILSLLSEADCDMKAVTEALSHDPALVAKLIKVSNSSLYGGYQETGSVNQAIVRLGMRATRSVIVAASTRNLFPMDSSRKGLLGRSLWEHAVQSGLAARRVAEFTRHADPDEAFAGGVLHDIGKVIMLLNRPDDYAEVHKRLEQGAPESTVVEREVLGFDHCLVGDRLLEGWGMPGNLRAIARWHHAPNQAGEPAALVHCVACGDLLGQRLCDRNGADSRLEERLAESCAALGLDEAALSELEELLTRDLQQSDLLD